MNVEVFFVVVVTVVSTPRRGCSRIVLMAVGEMGAEAQLEVVVDEGVGAHFGAVTGLGDPIREMVAVHEKGEHVV